MFSAVLCPWRSRVCLDLLCCLPEWQCIAPEWLTTYGWFIRKLAGSDCCLRRVLQEPRQVYWEVSALHWNTQSEPENGRGYKTDVAFMLWLFFFTGCRGAHKYWLPPACPEVFVDESRLLPSWMRWCIGAGGTRVPSVSPQHSPGWSLADSSTNWVGSIALERLFVLRSR